MENDRERDKKDHTEVLWKQYAMWVDLFKFYIDITIRINIFYYAITGAILSYYLSHSSEPLIKYSLLLPVGMSLAFLLLFIIGMILLEVSRREVFSIRDELGLIAAPEFRVLSLILAIFSFLFLVVAIAMIVLLVGK